MNPNKALWEKGDFTRVAARMRESGEALVKDLGITKGLDVLDLGCGVGHDLALLAALGVSAVGTDLSSVMIETAAARTGRRRSPTRRP